MNTQGLAVYLAMRWCFLLTLNDMPWYTLLKKILNTWLEHSFRGSVTITIRSNSLPIAGDYSLLFYSHFRVAISFGCFGIHSWHRFPLIHSPRRQYNLLIIFSFLSHMMYGTNDRRFGEFTVRALGMCRRAFLCVCVCASFLFQWKYKAIILYYLD